MSRFSALAGGLLAAASLLPLGCQSPLNSPGAAAPDAPAELLQQPFLFEIVRHLYRWQLSETEVERLVSAERCTFWVRRMARPLDPGDRSVLGEILLPHLGVRVVVKKADYRIDELNAEAKSRTFRITQISRETPPRRPQTGAQVVSVSVGEMRDYLFRTRSQLDQADPALIVRLQQALRREAAQDERLAAAVTAGEKVVHVAPLSPVSNELWAFWEGGRKLFSFASDIDLSNPAVWEHETLLARIYDLDEQVVVSHEEAPGSNRFLTRDQVSRAMFNCVLYGQRVTVSPSKPPVSDAVVTR